METYRMSSKLREQEREYLIQTANDVARGAIATTIYVDGSPAETIQCPHPQEIKPEEVLSLVKSTHYEKKQEVELLLQSYRRVLQDGHPLTMHQLAVMLYHKGFLFEALDLLHQATHLNPELHQSFNQLAMVELAMGRMKPAVAAAERAVAMRPNFADYRNNLGEALLGTGESLRAIAQFEQAVTVNLYYADAYFNMGLGWLHQAMSSPQPAVLIARVADAMRKACLIYPEYSGQMLDSAMAALKEHDLSRSYEIFISIREARREVRRHELAATFVHTNLVPEQLAERSLQERISVLTGQVARYPIYPDLQSELGQAYLETARLACERSIQHFRKASELNPSLTRNLSAMERAEDILDHLDSLLGKVSQKG